MAEQDNELDTGGDLASPPPGAFDINLDAGQEPGKKDGRDPLLKVGVTNVVSQSTTDFNPDEAKAGGAKRTAKWLLYAFCGTIAATFLTLFLIFGLSASPSQAKSYVEGFVPMITAMESFITKVFAPLLAFVLGYYFGQKEGS